MTVSWPQSPTKSSQDASSDDNTPKKRKEPVKKKVGRHETERRFNDFTNIVEHTVDAMRVREDFGSATDLREHLLTIKREYNDVHFEVEKKEAELRTITDEIKKMDAEALVRAAEPHHAGIPQHHLLNTIDDVCAEIDAATECGQVYRHMVNRLTRELRIVQQKILLMEEHCGRKTRDILKHQVAGRRVDNAKVISARKLEDLEHDLDLERDFCSAALDDLDGTLKHRKSEARHREEFDRWRHDVAMDAASEAFETTVSKFRKRLAIEKLVGNCLQKQVFEQSVQGQATEDGFQKIRQVTGLTDVMDIVKKFLNREVEHEQLKASAAEAESQLQRLRDVDKRACAENAESVYFLAEQPDPCAFLVNEVSAQECALIRTSRCQDEQSRTLRDYAVLLSHVVGWSQRMAKSMHSFAELQPATGLADLTSFMARFVEVVDTFLGELRAEAFAAKLARVAKSASDKEHSEIQRLLGDLEFRRNNCRVAAALGQRAPKQKYAASHPDEDDEDQFEAERERLKVEAWNKISARALGGGGNPRRRSTTAAYPRRSEVRKSVATPRQPRSARTRPSAMPQGSAVAAARAAAGSLTARLRAETSS